MWIDKRSKFASSQALTAGTTALTDHIDLGGDFDIGVGKPLYWVLVIESITAAGAGTPTYVFTLQTDDNDSFSSPETIATITVLEGAASGTIYWTGVPNRNERYLRAVGVLADAGGTAAATVTSFLTSEKPADYRALPQNINVP